MGVEIRTFEPGPELETVSDDVWKLLCVLDDQFVPALSKRKGIAGPELGPEVLSTESLWGGPVGYFEDLMTHPTALAYIDGTCAGIVCWQDNWVDALLGDEYNPNFRILTIATHPEHTMKGVATALFNKVREVAHASNCDWVIARNWSGSAGLKALDRNGFKEVERLKDHRGPGVDTIYLAVHSHG